MVRATTKKLLPNKNKNKPQSRLQRKQWIQALAEMEQDSHASSKSHSTFFSKESESGDLEIVSLSYEDCEITICSGVTDLSALLIDMSVDDNDDGGDEGWEMLPDVESIYSLESIKGAIEEDRLRPTSMPKEVIVRKPRNSNTGTKQSRQKRKKKRR